MTMISDIDRQLTPSHDQLVKMLDRMVGRDETNSDVYVSILWSYGMYVPPSRSLRKKVVAFMDKTGLWRHPHFRTLAGVRRWLCGCPSLWIGMTADTCLASPYVHGMWLTGAEASVFREGSVLLSTLLGYNEGLPCFQQWPWVANVDGVVVWCGFGESAKSSVLGNSDSDSFSARILPYIRSCGNRLMADYRARYRWMNWMNRKTRPQMRWPVEQFDETQDYDGWTIGRKNHAVVAYRVRGVRVEVVVRDLRVSGQSMEGFRGSLWDYRL